MRTRHSPLHISVKTSNGETKFSKTARVKRFSHYNAQTENKRAHKGTEKEPSARHTNTAPPARTVPHWGGADKATITRSEHASRHASFAHAPSRLLPCRQLSRNGATRHGGRICTVHEATGRWYSAKMEKHTHADFHSVHYCSHTSKGKRTFAMCRPSTQSPLLAGCSTHSSVYGQRLHQKS